MSKTTTLLDLESMADETLDDFKEAAEYIQPPAGDYKLKTVSGKIAKFENDDGIKQSIRITIGIDETLELATDTEPPVPDGSAPSKTESLIRPYSCPPKAKRSYPSVVPKGAAGTTTGVALASRAT